MAAWTQLQVLRLLAAVARSLSADTQPELQFRVAELVTLSIEHLSTVGYVLCSAVQELVVCMCAVDGL
jgi:hypothetical protein